MGNKIVTLLLLLSDLCLEKALSIVNRGNKAKHYDTKALYDHLKNVNKRHKNRIEIINIFLEMTR